jgi:hypothetical protein
MPSPICQYVIKLVVNLPTEEVQLYLWMSRCGKIVHLTTRFFMSQRFNILTLLSLLSWCRLSFQIFGLKTFSLPTFALQSLNRIFIWHFGKSSTTCSKSLVTCLLNQYFSPHLVRAYSEQWYYTSNIIYAIYSQLPSILEAVPPSAN